MCFSATASFVTAAALTPVGVLAVTMANRRDAGRWLPLAFLPLLFAMQQALEGIVWLGLDHGASVLALRPASLAYLGFAFALWPIWMPWCTLRLAAGHAAAWQRRLTRLLWGMGCLMAVLLWLPLLLDSRLISPIVRHGSIDYQVRLPWAESVNHLVVTLIYGLIICLPLLLNDCRRLRWLAVALVVSFAITQLAFLYAFSSVWCFFSALLSVLVIWILLGEAPLGKLS